MTAMIELVEAARIVYGRGWPLALAIVFAGFIALLGIGIFLIHKGLQDGVL